MRKGFRVKQKIRHFSQNLKTMGTALYKGKGAVLYYCLHNKALPDSPADRTFRPNFHKYTLNLRNELMPMLV